MLIGSTDWSKALDGRGFKAKNRYLQTMAFSLIPPCLEEPIHHSRRILPAITSPDEFITFDLLKHEHHKTAAALAAEKLCHRRVENS